MSDNKVIAGQSYLCKIKNERGNKNHFRKPNILDYEQLENFSKIYVL
jgi:hypothetical protein